MTNRFSLDHLTGLSLSGPDARAFAQSQFTVSVDALPDGTWAPLAWCDSKGRVLAVMMACRSEQRVDLVLPAEQAESVRKRLGMYTIGRDVELTAAGAVAATHGLADGFLPLALDASRGLCIGRTHPHDAEQVRRWRRRDMCQGLAWLTPETAGRHLPQSLGLEPLGALVFDKGCYPGQEVIARLHFRGSVKYHLAGLVFEGEPPPSGRAARLSDEAGAKLGECLEALPLDDCALGLAVMSTRVEPRTRVVVHEAGREHFARVTTPEGLC